MIVATFPIKKRGTDPTRIPVSCGRDQTGDSAWPGAAPRSRRSLEIPPPIRPTNCLDWKSLPTRIGKPTTGEGGQFFALSTRLIERVPCDPSETFSDNGRNTPLGRPDDWPPPVTCHKMGIDPESSLAGTWMISLMGILWTWPIKPQRRSHSQPAAAY
mgnify:CR=1 FL=1